MAINLVSRDTTLITPAARTLVMPNTPNADLPVPPKLPVNMKVLEKAVAQLSQDFGTVGIEFDIHDDSGRIVTRVIDRESGDVLRQIPTEEVLHMARLAAHERGRLLQTTA